MTPHAIQKSRCLCNVETYNRWFKLKLHNTSKFTQVHSHLWIFKTVPHSMIYIHTTVQIQKKIQSTWSALIASLLYKYIYIPFSDVRYFSTNVLHTWWLAKLSLSISIFLFFFYLFFFLFISSNNHTTSTIFF